MKTYSPVHIFYPKEVQRIELEQYVSEEDNFKSILHPVIIHSQQDDDSIGILLYRSNPPVAFHTGIVQESVCRMLIRIEWLQKRLLEFLFDKACLPLYVPWPS